jgi:hypothetical protein
MTKCEKSPNGKHAPEGVHTGICIFCGKKVT